MVSVSVPAIVTRDIWEAAQTMRTRNRAVRKHDTEYEYLLKGYIFCEHCGHRMAARTSHVGGKLYTYYRCNAYKLELAKDCDFGNVHYRAQKVDEAVWEWIKSLLKDPKQLEIGLEVYRTEREQLVAPLRERLAVVEAKLAATKDKLDRLLDLYLSRVIEQGELAKRREQLEPEVRVLGREAEELRASLAEQTVSIGQIQSIQELREEIAKELDTANTDTETKRYLINMLDVQTWLRDQDGEKSVLVRCGLGMQSLSVKSKATCARSPNKNQRQLLPYQGQFGQGRGRRRSQ
jgi:site-specific DNA recombinase